VYPETRQRLPMIARQPITVDSLAERLRLGLLAPPLP
jgi:hypothetical protein